MKTTIKPATIRDLEAHLAPGGMSLAHGWAVSNPWQVQAWEADGSLLGRLKEAEEQGRQAEDKARRDGMTHLSGAEVNELYGGPSHKL